VEWMDADAPTRVRRRGDAWVDRRDRGRATVPGPDGLRRLLNGEPGALALLPPGESLRLTVRITVAAV
jgi:hypothetical protein